MSIPQRRLFPMAIFFISGLAAAASAAAASAAAPLPASMQVQILRLKPGDLLLETLQAWAKENRIEAASILSAVGSLKKASLRFADQPRAEVLEGPLEVVSLSGTLSKDSQHLHASLSDSKGATRGGHLTGENRVYTTLELVLGVYPEVRFLREPDPASGFSELVVRPRGGKP